jgi:hypothetical protein
MTSMEQDTFTGGKRSHEDPHGAGSDPVGLVETASKRMKRGESISLNKLSSGNRASGSDATGDIYKPRSQITSSVYKEILALLQPILSGESSETLAEAAHEAISIMKSEEGA